MFKFCYYASYKINKIKKFKACFQTIKHMYKRESFEKFQLYHLYSFTILKLKSNFFSQIQSITKIKVKINLPKTSQNSFHFKGCFFNI